MKRTTFTMSLSREVFSRLTAVARRLDISRAAVLRMALSDFFRRHEPDSKDSGTMGLRTNKMEDLLKTQISMLPIAVHQRKRNRIDLPVSKPTPTGDKDPES